MILMHYKELKMICFKATKHHLFKSLLLNAIKIQWIKITFQLNVNQMLLSIIFQRKCYFFLILNRNKFISINIYKNLFLKLSMKFSQYTRHIIYHLFLKVILD